MKRIIIALIALSFIFVLAAGSRAATTIYSDASDWKIGAGNWLFVDETQITTGFAELTGNTLSLPFGNSVNFGDTILYGLQVPDEWATWSGGNMPKVLYTAGVTSVTGTFNAPIYGFGIEVEPTAGMHDITFKLSDGSFLTQSVNGDGGAEFFGFIGTGGISSFTISSDADFAMGRAIAAVPEPGVLLFLASGLLGVMGLRVKMKG